VEEHAAIPERLALVIDVGRLPGVDGRAPGGGICEAVAGDGPCSDAGRAVKIGVAAMPFAPGTEFNDGQIPSDNHGNDARFARFESEADGEGSGEIFAATGPGIVAVGEFAVL